MIRRRTFLAALALGGAGLAGWRLLGSTPEHGIAKVLHKKLYYLKLDAAGVQQFARDFTQRMIVSRLKLRSIDAVGPLYTRLRLEGHGRVAEAAHHGEDRIITEYLISTDFFVNGADETRVVRYLGYYNAMVACSNPFARPVELPAG